MLQTWQCQTCGAACQRKTVRGQRPKYCSRKECRPKTLSDRRCERCGARIPTNCRRYCSTTCQWPEELRRPTVPKLTRRERAEAKALKSARGIVAESSWVSGPCAICGRPFLARNWGRSTARCCSDRCNEQRRHREKRVGKHRRRAAKRNAFVANVSPRKVYERDRWRCHLCGRKVWRTVAVPHPLAPTIDHLVPLAKGGTHEPANCATAHFLCNATKSDRGGGEQLALIG